MGKEKGVGTLPNMHELAGGRRRKKKEQCFCTEDTQNAEYTKNAKILAETSPSKWNAKKTERLRGRLSG